MPLDVSDGAADRQTLVDFLLDTFHLGPAAPFVAPDLLRWKYDDPRPDWSGPRSFVWTDNGATVAHACMCPVTYSLPGGEVSGSYLIDWAAARSSAGAGVSLLRALGRKCDALFAVGGSPDTRTILPKLGYRHIGNLHFFARPLRPWKQVRSDPYPRGWKGPLRLMRNVAWSRNSMPDAGREWSVSPVVHWTESAQALFDARANSKFACTKRTPELMNYFMRCPAVTWAAALLVQHSTPRGWYVLARIGGQIRIADLWMDSDATADWTAAYSLACRTAYRDPNAYELTASASIPPAIEAAARVGLRYRHAEPIFVLDPKKRFAGSPPLNVTFLESDLAYISDPSYPYLT